jgi:hypothetical protein
MSPDVLLYLITSAVVISAVALVLQALFMFGVYRSSRATRDQVNAVAGHVESFVSSAQETMALSRKQLSEVTEKAKNVLEVLHKDLVQADEILGEVTARARIQMDRVEMVLDDTVSRVQETIALLNKGILRPIREINALAAGVSAALGFLFRGRRISVERATHDEEMFI